jgi:replication factor C small subunit
MCVVDLKQTVESSLWVEKYKPATIEDVLIEEHLKEKFREYIKDMEIPGLIFEGSPGNGKTTCAKIIANAISDDVLFINASNESGIETVRNKIEPFCSTSGWGEKGEHKIVILDEMEMSSDNFQRALREMIERFYNTARFILTCNYVNKVEPALLSRTQHYRFGNIKQLEVMKRCMAILQTEGVEYDKKNLANLIKALGSDMRRIVNNMQKLTQDGKLTSFTSLEEKQLELLELLQKKKLTEFRKFYGENNMNPDETCKFLFNKIFEKQLGDKNWTSQIAEISEVAYRLKIGVDPEITLMNGILQIMQLM